MQHVDRSRLRRTDPRPATGEAPFRLDEVFFSRTDARGVIQSGNHVFRRVAHFDWDELLGAPHKIIRHGDMPKGVFWYFWDTLKQGNAIGAYVKNLAKDGLHYWVFAVAVPCDGGFISARIKPSSALFAKVGTLYQELLNAEQDQKLTPEQSSALMLRRLKELGFPTYRDFSAHALSEEMFSSDRLLGRPANEKILNFRHMLDDSGDLRNRTAALVEEFNRVKIIPHNMRVIASRIEPTGGPVSTLSKNYGMMSNEISSWFESNVVGPNSHFATIHESITRAMFLQGMVGILARCNTALGEEKRDLQHLDVEAERALLHALSKTYAHHSSESLNNVRIEAGRILTICSEMGRHILGLGTTRVMAKIENARLAAGHLSHRKSEGLGDIIEQLKGFQDRVGDHLDQIHKIGSEIINAAGKVRKLP